MKMFLSLAILAALITPAFAQAAHATKHDSNSVVQKKKKKKKKSAQPSGEAGAGGQ